MSESKGETRPDGAGDEGETEVEATLAVSSEAPADVAERIVGLGGVGDHRLEWRGAEELRDVYLDTADGGLRERGLALRLRQGVDGWRVTLKGEPRPAPGGGVERSELEVGWSAIGLERILEALRGRGVSTPRSASGGPASAGRESPAADSQRDAEPAPPDVLRGAGFTVVQERRTLRRTAAVLPPGGGGRPVAWLVVDTVRFRSASGRPILHREVEIEATPAAPEGLPGHIAGQLRERFGESLRPWEHGKLATGAAVAGLDPPVGADGELLPTAYDLLDEELRRG